MHRVGDDAGLRAGERNRLVAEVVDCHRGERAGDPLPDGDEHVQLARRGPAGDLAGEVEELVRRAAHRRQHGDDARAAFSRGDEPSGDVLELVGIGHRGAAELHHDRAEMRRRVVPFDRGDGLVVRRRHG